MRAILLKNLIKSYSMLVIDLAGLLLLKDWCTMHIPIGTFAHLIRSYKLLNYLFKLFIHKQKIKITQESYKPSLDFLFNTRLTCSIPLFCGHKFCSNPVLGTASFMY